MACGHENNATSHFTLGIEGYSDEEFERTGVFIDPSSKLAKEATPGIFNKFDDSKAYLIGSGVYRKATHDEETNQIVYDDQEIPVLIIFNEGFYQQSRGHKDVDPVLSNGITIMKENGEVIKSIAISAEHLQYKGEPFLVSE